MAQRNKKIINKLKHKYRLVLREDNNLKEKTSIKLNLLNIILLSSIGILLFFTLFFVLFKYTSLGNTVIADQLRGSSKEMLINTDRHLKELIRRNEINMEREAQLRLILQGEISTENVELLQDKYAMAVEESPKKQTKEDSPIDSPVEKAPTEKKKKNYNLFSPVKGKISRGFDLRFHPAVDVIPDKYDAVNSIKEGIVIFASWTPEFGHVIALQHTENLISIYKHNSVLFKKVGTFVDAGESIAIVGNSGELTSGKHLHFELWEDGRSVDPSNYVSF